MFQLRKYGIWGLAVLLLSLSHGGALAAGSQQAMDDILALREAPAGVVFEVVAADEAYLQTALKDFEAYREQLRERFPGIQLAIVSHGSEQFALTKTNQPVYHKAHGLVKRIVADNVPVHVCGGHAAWRGLEAEDFPEYVDVSASGPSEISAYQALGYVLVIL